MADDKVKIQRALISVSDKTGLVDFAKELAAPWGGADLYRWNLQSAEGRRFKGF
jgi:hypothetical protein